MLASFAKQKLLVIVALILSSLVLIHYVSFLSFQRPTSNLLPQHSTSFLEGEKTNQTKNEAPAKSKFAFATFLSTRVEDDDKPDPYFTATRVLTYQLLHRPETRSQKGYQFLVVVPPHVSKKKQKILADEGATVIEVKPLSPESWAPSPGRETWVDQFTKLRLFQLTDYERIAYMDNDMLVTKNLDGIFEEKEVTTPIVPGNSANILDDEAPLPADYVLAAVTDNEGPGGDNHPVPISNKSRLNGGFFVLRPCAVLFKYYRTVLEHKDRFDVGFMEMGLLNYAHRFDGNMPWNPLAAGKWNSNWPSLKDMQRGSATLHDKFWEPANKGWIDRELVELWWRVQGQMEGYWQKMKGD